MSILLRRDGFSLARCKDGRRGRKTGRIGELLSALDAWADADAEAWVCAPTGRAVLIPGEIAPQNYGRLLAAQGFAEAPGQRLLASPVGDKVLLHTIEEAIYEPLAERFGEGLLVLHPLTVSLRQPEEAGAVLQIDCTDGLGSFTFTEGGALLWADVLPVENDASIGVIVGSILAGRTDVRIVCSGERCKTYPEWLSRSYPVVELHADGEHRNLFFPLSCG